jgi:ceramide glucosyltransferase
MQWLHPNGPGLEYPTHRYIMRLMVGWLAFLLLGVYGLDRLLKHVAVSVFFHRPPPPPPAAWPSISLIQPITHSPNDLQAALRSRAKLAYPGTLQHILVYDALDRESLGVVERAGLEAPGWQPDRLPVQQPGCAIASKTFKLNAALSSATGEVVCFVDDDILLPPDALQMLVAHLAQPSVGAVFGLACYTRWTTLWSGLMSAFVNSQALLTYVPFTFFLEPFTITGHCYALRRQVFEAAGGLTGMQDRLDDDHEMARRTRALGLRLCQTPLIYQVDNALPSWPSYQAQMKRWFVFPRQMMLPYLSHTEQAASLLGTIPSLIPGGLALLAILTRQPSVWLTLAVSLVVFHLVYALEERHYLRHPTPLIWWPLVWLSAILAPFLVVWALFSDDEIEWRGQRLRILRGGRFQRL